MSKKKLIENISSLGAVQFFNLVLPLISFPYIAVKLGVNQLGHMAFALSVAQIMGVLTDYGFNLSAPKAISIYRDDPKKILQIWSAITLLRTLFALTGFVLIIILAFFFKRFHDDLQLLIIAYVMVIGNVLFPQWLFQGLEQLKVVSIIQIISRFIVFFGTFALIHKPEDVYWAVFLQSSGLLIGGVIAFPYTIKSLSGVRFNWPKKSEVQHQLIEGWHVFLSTAAINIYTTSNAFFLGLICSPTIVGYYHVAEKLIRAVQMLFAPISNAVYPYVSRLATTDRLAVLLFNHKLLIIFVTAATLFTMSIYLLAPYIVKLIFGEQFILAVPILQIFSLLPMLIVVSNIFGIQTMLPLGMQVQFSRILFFAALLDLVVFIPAVYLNGALGAAWTNVIVELFVSVSMGLILHRRDLSPLSTKLKKYNLQGQNS